MVWWKSITAKWHKLRCLSWTERWLLLQAVVLLPLTRLALRVFGFNRWHSALTRWAPLFQTPHADRGDILIQQARATNRIVKIAAFHGCCRASCLHQSLTLWWLLRRQGIAGALRIGVRKERGDFEAHAWVEYGDVVLNDRADVSERFARFDRPILPVGRNG